ATTTVQDEYMPLWVKQKALQIAPTKVEIVSGKGIISNFNSVNNQITFAVDGKESIRVRVNVLYWPGWIVYDGTNKLSFSYDNPQGVIEFFLPKGSHQIKAVFAETQMRMIADLISVVSFCLLLFIRFRLRKG